MQWYCAYTVHPHCEKISYIYKLYITQDLPYVLIRFLLHKNDNHFIKKNLMASLLTTGTKSTQSFFLHSFKNIRLFGIKIAWCLIRLTFCLRVEHISYYSAHTLFLFIFYKINKACFMKQKPLPPCIIKMAMVIWTYTLWSDYLTCSIL